MEIQFSGAAREVGRSGILLDTGKSKILLDYGIKLGEEGGPLRPLPVHGFLDAVVLSHGHLDHSGAIPYLFYSSEPNIYTHPSTVPLIDILLRDSMKIARSKNLDVYGSSNVKRMLRNVKEVNYNQKHQITPDIQLKSTDAGHILGSSITHLQADDKKIIYTGDYKDENTRLHKGADAPKDADVLIIEATYGSKEHPNRQELEKEFVESIKAVVEAGGSVVVPAFAVGRSQEMIQLLYSSKIPVPVYLDGMGRTVSEIYLEYPDLLRDYDEFYKAMKWANWITDYKQREQVFNEPSVIVTTAGMLSGGPVMNYLPELRTLNNAALFFTGFQVPGTPGREMLDTKRMDLAGVKVDFSNVDVKYFDFSAHCDKHGIQKFVKSCDPKLVLVQHGEPEQCEEVVDWVESEIGCFAFAPKLREKFKVEDFV